MKILFITPQSPDNRRCGGGVRSGFMLQALQELGEVTVVSGLPSAFKWRLPWFLPIPIMKFHRLMDRLYFRKEEILERLRLKGAEFDCVVVRYVGPMNTNAAWKIAPAFLDIDDLPSQAVDTLRRKADSWWKRKLIVALLKPWQRAIIKRSTGFWVCNPEQIPMLKKYGKWAYLPNVADPPREGYRYDRVEPLEFLTVGGMSYSANYEGVEWFIAHVWPRIHVAYPGAVYNLVGGGAPEHLKLKWEKTPGVKVWGFVDDLAARYEAANIVIAPIFSGAGTCIKVVEAALHGRKVFASSFGARGLSDVDRERLQVSVCESARAFVSDIESFIKLTSNEKTCCQRAIAEEARKVVSYERFAQAVKTLINANLARGEK